MAVAIYNTRTIPGFVMFHEKNLEAFFCFDFGFCKPNGLVESGPAVSLKEIHQLAIAEFVSRSCR